MVNSSRRAAWRSPGAAMPVRSSLRGAAGTAQQLARGSVTGAEAKAWTFRTGTFGSCSMGVDVSKKVDGTRYVTEVRVASLSHFRGPGASAGQVASIGVSMYVTVSGLAGHAGRVDWP